MFQIRQFYYWCVCLQPAVITFITKILFLSNCDLNPTGCRSFLFSLKQNTWKKRPRNRGAQIYFTKSRWKRWKAQLEDGDISSMRLDACDVNYWRTRYCQNEWSAGISIIGPKDLTSSTKIFGRRNRLYETVVVLKCLAIGLACCRFSFVNRKTSQLGCWAKIEVTKDTCELKDTYWIEI